MTYPMDTRFVEWPNDLTENFSMGIRVATCNIRNGGNSRNTPELLATLLKWNIHTLVLTEFRVNAVGKGLLERLKLGSYHIAYTDVQLGVLIASKDSFVANYNPMRLPSNDGKMLEAAFASWRLYGIYFPQDELKYPHFEHLLEHAAKETGSATMAIGDFNTGRNQLDVEPFRHGIPSGTAFSSEAQYLNLELLWTEAWRDRHPQGDQYTFYIPRYRLGGYSGYRIDHCFLSPTLKKRLKKAVYLHETRQLNLTDHSALIVDIANR